MKNKNQKGMVAQILLIAGIVVALGIIGYVLYSQRLNQLSQTSFYNPSAVPSPLQKTYQQSGQSVTPITNSAGLGSASTSLDSTDMTQIDTQLNALNSASSGF